MRSASLLLTLAILCCSPAPAPEQPSTTTERENSPGNPAPVTPPPPDPSDPARRNLFLDSPTAEAAVTDNPLVIRGRARTFENHVTIELLDPRGELLVRTFATAQGELGHHNPFTTEIFLTRDPGPSVIVRLVDHSAADGSVREEVSRELPFKVPMRDLTLFFPAPLANPAAECNQLTRVERKIPTSRSLLRLAIEALIAGPLPSEKQATAIFPPGSAVRGVNVSGSRAIVDFNDRLVNAGGACRATAIRAAVEATAKALPGIESVEIRANGSAAEALQP